MGIIIDGQLQFEHHMYAKIKKANNMMRLMRESLVNLDEDILWELYKSLVSYHLEYAQTV